MSNVCTLGATCPTAYTSLVDRRYEDFSTVGKSVLFTRSGDPAYLCLALDWIQDSLHERNIRLKKITGDYPSHAGTDFFSRMRNVSGVIGIVYRFFARVLEEGQTWVVFGLVGE